MASTKPLRVKERKRAARSLKGGCLSIWFVREEIVSVLCVLEYMIS